MDRLAKAIDCRNEFVLVSADVGHSKKPVVDLVPEAGQTYEIVTNDRLQSAYAITSPTNFVGIVHTEKIQSSLSQKNLWGRIADVILGCFGVNSRSAQALVGVQIL
mmetsp:Transcript_63778/g.170877  ORF Transcript_63778/g.170877 Transcript_63778/m.170877 type:complete len:106 (+) Transcript_63778:41-358(+)